MLGEVSAALNRAEIGHRRGAGRAGRTSPDCSSVSPTARSPARSPRTCSTRCGRAKAIADAIIAKRGLKQISDEGAIEKLVDDVLAANPAIVAEFRAGKEKAFNSLVGKAMGASKGKANPAQVNAILRRRLGG